MLIKHVIFNYSIFYVDMHGAKSNIRKYHIPDMRGVVKKTVARNIKTKNPICISLLSTPSNLVFKICL